MGYLKDKSVYLAGSMHAVKDDGCGWRDMITPILGKRWGMKVEDPAKKSANGVCEVKDDKEHFKKLIADGMFGDLKKQFKPIVRKDLRCVDKADLIIAHYNPKVHMFGTIHELVLAHIEQKPIYIKYEKEHQEDINPWLFTLIEPEWIFSEWDGIYNRLDMIDAGKINADYWTL